MSCNHITKGVMTWLVAPQNMSKVYVFVSRRGIFDGLFHLIPTFSLIFEISLRWPVEMVWNRKPEQGYWLSKPALALDKGCGAKPWRANLTVGTAVHMRCPSCLKG